MLVINFGGVGINLLPEGRVLLEHPFTFINILNDLFRLENAYCALADIELERWPRNSHGGIARALPLVLAIGSLVGSSSRHIESQATLNGRYRVESAVIIVSDLSKVSDSLGE